MKVMSFVRKAKSLFLQWTQKPEYIYLIIASIGVIGFALITPPFQGPDEEAHYVRTQYISHGYFIPVSVNNSNASLPKSISDVIKITFYNDDLRGSSSKKYELYRTKEALKVPLEKQNTYKPAMIAYSPVPYLPAAPGVFLANVFNVNPLISMYIARLLLGFASIGLFFLAIRLIPHKKYLFAAVGLTPTLLFQQSVITADSVSYAVLGLFIASVLHLRETKQPSKRQWLLIGALCITVTLAKPLLYLFLPLVLLLVKKKSDFKWIAGIGVVCIVALLGWLTVSNIKSDAITISGMPTDVNSQKQIETLTSHPTRGLRVAWNSYMTSYGDDEVRGIIGIFGAADTIYPLWMFVGYTFLLGFLYSVSIEKRKIHSLHVGWMISAAILCAVYFAAVNLALYLGYTPVNFDIVYGVQGRYFLPILIIAAAIIFTGGVRIAKADIPKLTLWVTTSMVVLILFALLITYQRYYLYTP